MYCIIHRDPIHHCLTNVNLVPPSDRVLLESTHGKINTWALNILSASVRFADSSFKMAELNPSTSADQFARGGISLGALPVARFLLSALGVLTADHRSADICVILNSGVLGLSQTIMRLAGPCDTGEEEDAALAAIIDEGKTSKKRPTVPLTGPEAVKLMKIGTRVVRGPDWKWGDQVGHALCNGLLKSDGNGTFWSHRSVLSSCSYKFVSVFVLLLLFCNFVNFLFHFHPYMCLSFFPALFRSLFPTLSS